MVKFQSNKREVKARMKRANENMLEAVGKAAVGHIKLVTPVDTGALRGSIDYAVRDDSVYAGSTLMSEMYPIYVHEGVKGMGGRPYIRDGIMLNLGNLRSIAQRNYKL